MNTHPAWTVLYIRTPASDEHIAMYKSVRLAALLADPDVSTSSYESESSLSDRTWSSRVNTEGRHTLIAVQVDTGSPIGTLSIRGPELLAWLPKERPYPPFLEKEDISQETDVFLLTAVWVQPEFRGRGVGRMLVDYALGVIKTWPSISESQSSKRKTALLLVNDKQDSAKRLYRKAGFVEQKEGDVSGKQSTWMTVRMNQANNV